jgi:putative toxin-antitoxin system antitoxin component (TIGR02293 family)
VVGRGLPASVILRIERKLQLSTADIVRILEISASTRKRFNRTPRKRLDPALSDRIVRLASTVAEASDLLGDRQKAVEWFKTPIAALGDRRPMDLITSDPGARLVRDELGRIRYGHWA